MYRGRFQGLQRCCIQGRYNLGLGKQTVLEKVHFDTTKNRFLAAVDEFSIKYWDMDNINLLCTVDGGLPASPCIQFNKIGTLLAVSTNDRGVKILANAAGSQLLRFIGDHTGFSSKVTTTFVPQVWQPSERRLMTNDISAMNLEVVRVPFFSLSKNDMYLTSSSGGNISLFNMMTFTRESTFMTHPPPATSLAFFPPDNNVLAIGREDATILIYNIRTNELIATLNGHYKRVTALALSMALDVLASLGEDSKSFMDLQFPNGQVTYVSGEGFSTSAFLPLRGFASSAGSISRRNEVQFLLQVYVQQLVVVVLLCVELTHSVKEKLNLNLGCSLVTNPYAFSSVSISYLFFRSQVS